VEILRVWSRDLPADRVHVITVPPRGSGSGLLWDRFASVLGVDPAVADTSRARPNASLGMPEVEFLRRLNAKLPDEVPGWFYMWNVKEVVAHRAFATRPPGGRLVLPGSREPWAKEQADALIVGLRDSGYDIAGDLDELRPRHGGEPYSSPGNQPAERVLDAAVDAAAALVAHQYRRTVGGKRQGGRAGRAGVADRLESAVAGMPGVKRAVRELSSRYLAVRRLRITVWRLLERRRAASRG
jgi:hypothetical protein